MLASCSRQCPPTFHKELTCSTQHVQEVLLDPPNLMVPALWDAEKTAAAKASLQAMRAKMRKDFEEQWAALAPAEQLAMRKQWKVCARAANAWPRKVIRSSLGLGLRLKSS